MNPRPAKLGSATSLKGKALQCLSQREHSRKELAQKLQRWVQAQAQAEVRAQNRERLEKLERAGADLDVGSDAGSDAGFDASAHDDCLTAGEPADSPAAVNAVLESLTEAGLLSDTRFTESRLHARSKRFGNRRIEQELKQHGVAITDDQREKLRHSETERALAVLRTRKTLLLNGAGAGAGHPQQRLKIQRFLLARGFTPESIREALKNLGSSEEPADSHGD